MPPRRDGQAELDYNISEVNENHAHYTIRTEQSPSLPPLSLSSVSTSIFPGEPRLASFTGAKDYGSGGDNWSDKSCKAPVKLSPPTNQHPAVTGRMPFLLPHQQRQSTEWIGITLSLSPSEALISIEKKCTLFTSFTKVLLNYFTV